MDNHTFSNESLVLFIALVLLIAVMMVLQKKKVPLTTDWVHGERKKRKGCYNAFIFYQTDRKMEEYFPLYSARHDRETWPIPLLLGIIPTALKSPHTCLRLKPVKPTHSYYIQVIFAFSECEPIFIMPFSQFGITCELSLRRSSVCLSSSHAINPYYTHWEMHDHMHTQTEIYFYPQWYIFCTFNMFNFPGNVYVV